MPLYEWCRPLSGMRDGESQGSNQVKLRTITTVEQLNVVVLFFPVNNNNYNSSVALVRE
jgi:hypothetical protein